MTTPFDSFQAEDCPAEKLLKILSGKWKPQIFRLASEGPLRFNALLRRLPGSSKQSLTVALREMEEAGLLDRAVVRQKPLHVEYTLSARGASLIGVFQTLENWE